MLNAGIIAPRRRVARLAWISRGARNDKAFGLAGTAVGVEWVAPGREGRILRVQVKSTIYKRRGEGYSLNVMGAHRERYPSGVVDFFAVYLIPIDAWYIIPYALMGRTNCSLHFTPDSKRHKYAACREAWHLLRGE